VANVVHRPLASPLHPLGEALFSAHMLQHEMIMVIAVPLFARAATSRPPGLTESGAIRLFEKRVETISVLPERRG
jgi:cytochrome c oxidase assembly factor CtaG